MKKLSIATLQKNITKLVESSQLKIYSYINTTITETYFHIGRMIVENEQQGIQKATYAKATLEKLSEQLQAKYGRGYSVDNLENMRKLFIIYNKKYSKSISETVSRKLKKEENKTAVASIFKLSWSHYVVLIKIENEAERNFYEIESLNEQWGVRELKRQIETSLYERLVLSRNKKKVKELSKKGHVIVTAQDAVKDPIVLEFIDLKEKEVYSEADLEQALIEKLELFLKELGKGFLFVERQQRVTVDGDLYKIDLVFYHRILKCFVLIDLKLGTLKHQDIGQMQMYVNYYDRDIKNENESNTIGIVLCKNKKESTIKYTLPKDNKQIFASRYKMYLPEKQELLKLINDKKRISKK